MKEGVSNEKVIISFNADSGSSNDHKPSGGRLMHIQMKQKQQAKSWLSSHGYPPTRAGAEQAYQDYMDGKIDVPEADAYIGRKNQKNDIEEKNNIQL